MKYPNSRPAKAVFLYYPDYYYPDYYYPDYYYPDYYSGSALRSRAAAEFVKYAC